MLIINKIPSLTSSKVAIVFDNNKYHKAVQVATTG